MTDSPTSAKPTTVRAKISTLTTVEGIAALFERLTGRPMSEEEHADAQSMFDTGDKP